MLIVEFYAFDKIYQNPAHIVTGFGHWMFLKCPTLHEAISTTTCKKASFFKAQNKVLKTVFSFKS